MDIKFKIEEVSDKRIEYRTLDGDDLEYHILRYEEGDWVIFSEGPKTYLSYNVGKWIRSSEEPFDIRSYPSKLDDTARSVLEKAGVSNRIYFGN